VRPAQSETQLPLVDNSPGPEGELSQHRVS
jgi:hypothetical protein